LKQSAACFFWHGWQAWLGSLMSRFSNTTQGRRVFALTLRQTMKQQGAWRLLWLNIKQAFERAKKGR
jgi:hypothetical protein